MNMNLPKLSTAGERVRWARKRAGLNQEQLGAEIGLSRRSVYGLEVNEAPLTWPYAEAVAVATRVPSDWLMGQTALSAEPVGPCAPVDLPKGKWIVDMGLHERVLGCSSWEDLKGLLPAWVTPLQTTLALPISDRTALVDWAEARALQAQVDAHVVALMDLTLSLDARGSS